MGRVSIELTIVNNRLETLDLLVDCTNNRLYPRDPNQITAEVETAETDE